MIYIIGIMAIELHKKRKTLSVSMLAEGNSIRRIERMTEIHRDTIMRLGVRLGQACAKIMDGKMRGLQSAHIEVDEIWGFIGAKRKNADRAGVYGDVWTFIAIGADTKVIPSVVVGKRNAYHANAVIADLAARMQKRIQVSSDSLAADSGGTPPAIPANWQPRIEFLSWKKQSEHGRTLRSADGEMLARTGGFTRMRIPARRAFNPCCGGFFRGLLLLHCRCLVHNQLARLHKYASCSGGL